MDLIPRAEYFHSPVCPHGCLAAGCKPELCHVNFIRFGWFQRTVQALTCEGPVHLGGELPLGGIILCVAGRFHCMCLRREGSRGDIPSLLKGHHYKIGGVKNVVFLSWMDDVLLTLYIIILSLWILHSAWDGSTVILLGTDLEEVLSNFYNSTFLIFPIDCSEGQTWLCRVLC